MEYVLQGENIILKIYNIRIFKEDINLNSNTLLTVNIVSGDFSGSAEFDIDIRNLGKFSVDLSSMYETLSGTAQLKETYGQSLIKIISVGKGHFKLSGYFYLAYPRYALEFEAEIDQTMLKKFSACLYRSFCEYAVLK